MTTDSDALSRHLSGAPTPQTSAPTPQRADLAPADRSGLIAHLRERAQAIRRHDLTLIHRGGVGHPGGDLSAADILATLYFAILNVDPAQPLAPGRDRFILSKGHSSGALYATLALRGFFAVDELDTFAQPLSRLNAHPSRKVPGVEANTGPLGHGLPIAVGCALAAKMTPHPRPLSQRERGEDINAGPAPRRRGEEAAWRVYVLVGDGELDEGTNWEAAMAAAHHQLDNLTLIIDRNGLQLGDTTERTLALEPLADKWRAFGWAVREANGHDHGALLDALTHLPYEPGKPNCLIAHTHKGQGVSFMRDRAEWHHGVPTVAQLEAALKELQA